MKTGHPMKAGHRGFLLIKIKRVHTLFVFLLVLVSPHDNRLVSKELGGERKGDSNMRSVTFVERRHSFL
jgi:hypothetical protein